MAGAPNRKHCLETTRMNAKNVLVGAMAVAWRLRNSRAIPKQMRNLLPSIWGELDLLLRNRGRIEVRPLGRGYHPIPAHEFRKSGDIWFVIRRRPANVIEIHDVLWLPHRRKGYVSMYEVLMKSGLMPS